MTQEIVNRMKLEVTEWWYHPDPKLLLPDFWKIKKKQNNTGRERYENIGLATSNSAKCEVKPVPEDQGWAQWKNPKLQCQDPLDMSTVRAESLT